MSRASPLAGLPVRAVAARLLAGLRAGKGSLSDALPAADAALTDARDRALLRLLLYATLRSLYRRESALASLLQHPLAARAAEVEALLLLALTQLDQGIDSDYAVVDASVEATRALGQPQLASLVNAVLRRALRESQQIYAAANRDEQSRFEHPRWLIDRLRADWGDDADAILHANNQPPPLWLRVKRRIGGHHDLIDRLAKAGVATAVHDHLPDALRATDAGDVSQLPGWSEGVFSVQDVAAQAAVDLLDLRPGLRVLDACCAPGGKLAHICEREPALAEVIGLDSDGQRVERTRTALRRLGVAPRLKQADATRVSDWWQGTPFDRILIDAPCSGTGVIRRHPDIRLLRRPSDIAGSIDRQARLLDALWPLLAPGGRLVYATCSVLKDENERQIAAFLERQPRARVHAADLGWFSREGPFGSQNFPGHGDADGFFYAVLTHTG
jgi:16S rRNA (cytosine967-C5)-methyltransferase